MKIFWVANEKFWVFNENLGVSDQPLVVSDENLGIVHKKLKVFNEKRGLQWGTVGVYRISFLPRLPIYPKKIIVLILTFTHLNIIQGLASTPDVFYMITHKYAIDETL